MSKRNYEMGYDSLGRRIVLDEFGKYVTHIPGNLSETEVLTRLQCGTSFKFDARNQGMQNIPAAQVDESVEVKVAPREEWPVFYAWHIKWLEDLEYNEKRNFEEFKRDFLAKGLSPEQEWQIINAWKSQMTANPSDERSFDEFREDYISATYQNGMNNGEEIQETSKLCKK